jgi:Cu-processing system ATP-binding protein
VAEVLEFFAALRGLPAGAVPRALERVGLEGLAARRSTELSGGYSQRLSLAQALLGDAELLVLDEPTASLDPQATWEFRSLVEELRREGRTILLCSHLLAEVERVADRVLILLDGRRAALERMEALRTRQVKATRLLVEVEQDPTQALEALRRWGMPGEVAREKVLSLDSTNGRSLEALEFLRSNGVKVRSFELQRPTLEEIFLEAVQGARHEKSKR